MSSLEEKLIKIEIPKDRYNNATSKERQALYDFKKDKNMVVKGADKGSAVVVWKKEDYIKEAEKQLVDSDFSEEVPDDLGGDLKKESIKYFEVKDRKFVRFYLLPKLHKRLHNLPGRPVISNCNYYRENVSGL